MWPGSILTVGTNKAQWLHLTLVHIWGEESCDYHVIIMWLYCVLSDAPSQAPFSFLVYPVEQSPHFDGPGPLHTLQDLSQAVMITQQSVISRS